MVFVDMTSPLSCLALAIGSHQEDREVPCGIGPPLLVAQPPASEFQLEPLAPKLRADLDPEVLSRFEGKLALEAPHRDRVCLPRAETDVHPFALGIPARLVGEALLLDGRVQLLVDMREPVADA